MKRNSFICEVIDELHNELEKIINNDLWEVFTINQDGIEDAAIHVMKEKCVYQKALSVYKGVIFTNYIDLHTIDDVNKIKRIISESQ